jgi:hypothetical protein
MNDTIPRFRMKSAQYARENLDEPGGPESQCNFLAQSSYLTHVARCAARYFPFPYRQRR